MERINNYMSEETLKQFRKPSLFETTEEYNDLYQRIRKDKNWKASFMEMVRHYYQTECTGGTMHIVLDDGNLDDSDLYFCWGYANGVSDNEGADLATLMLAMTLKQREYVYDSI